MKIKILLFLLSLIVYSFCFSGSSASAEERFNSIDETVTIFASTESFTVITTAYSCTVSLDLFSEITGGYLFTSKIPCLLSGFDTFSSGYSY